MNKRNLKVSLSLFFLVSCMIGLTFASVPLYKLFCQITGYGGTPKINTLNQSSTNLSTIKEIKIEFNSDVNKKLNWAFKPMQRSIKIKLGEPVLAFYKAKNLSNESITGTATYNVLPFEAATYFNKIDCFCFKNQTLEPGEEIILPVNFYIDPKILEDKSTNYIDSIVLSYTFFYSNNNFEKVSQYKY